MFRRSKKIDIKVRKAYREKKKKKNIFKRTVRSLKNNN